MLPHAQPKPKEHPVGVEHPRHIIFPFDIHRDPSEFNAENRKSIYRIFPEIEVLAFDKHFLLLCMRTLPPKPWPRTIAGVPAYFTTDQADEGPIAPIKRFGSSRIRLHGDLDCRHDPAQRRQVFELIRRYFSEVSIEITEIQYWRNFVVVVLENDETDLTAVPRAVASCPCYYLFESEMGRPKDFPSLHIKKSGVDSIYDDSEYTVLRPGVMLSSGKDELKGHEVLTTAGVFVKDKDGNEYMTVTSHSFPHGSRVFHPHTGGREIGEIVMELPSTDVALVKLHDGERFTNKLFESSHMLKPPPSLKVFIHTSEITPGDLVFMDTPFTGYEEGTANVAAATRVRRIPTDDSHEPAMEWMDTRWDYMGQGSVRTFVDGACGSVIWNEEGNVVGFFRYGPVSGHFVDWCQSVSADHLIDWGLTVI
ncbi:hypothetical protein PRK78_004645 [Emydomyces testavorans]|uniref:Uncharacterized protein n=1 Tax=Emydomyces testavorans TaxID=2070801 RepID=A0AAF0DI38_9EURO|nr:hypothetical protein PRK78_004645 [Emydomyces testavorans]